MKENLSNSKINKAKIYKGLAIAGVSVLTTGGVAGIIASVVDIATTKEKNLGTDYGQGLNFNLQFSLNNSKFNEGNGISDIMTELQDTANALSSKLYKLGLKQIKLTPRIAFDQNVDNDNLSANFKPANGGGIYGVIDVNIDSQEGTRWYLDPKTQGLFNRLNQATSDSQKIELIKQYAEEFYPNTPNANKLVVKELAQNAANKLAIYFATENIGNVSLAPNTTQPILNNTNILEIQNVNKGSKKGTNSTSSEPQYKNPLLAPNGTKDNKEISFKNLNNSRSNTKLVEINDNGLKTINFQVLLGNLPNKFINWKPYNATGSGINTQGSYLDLSGFMNQFNNVFEWQKHNQNSPDDEWETISDAYEAKRNADSNFESSLPAPQTTWLIWSNRSGLINRLNYLALLAYFSQAIESYNNVDLFSEYWNNLVGDKNRSFKEFSDNKKDISGKLVAAITDQNNEETKYYYWVKEQLINGNPLTNYFYNFNVISPNENVIENAAPKIDEKLTLRLNEFYTSKLFKNTSSDDSNSSGDSDSSTNTTPPATYAVATETNYDWIRSWEWANHDLISPYGNVIDYANFFKFFQFEDLNDVFGKTELENYNSKNTATPIDKYNAAFTNKIYYDTNQNSLSDAQSIIDEFTAYNYQNSLINTQLLDTNNQIVKSTPPTPTPETIDVLASSEASNLKNNLKPFDKFINDFATLSTASLKNSAIGLDAWTSTIIGFSIVVLIVGIIISILYRVPGAFAAITAFLAGSLSIIAYRNLNLTFSFDTSIALLAGIFISFITIVNFLSHIPRLLKEKNLNLKFGIIKSFKYFIKNSLGIHVTALIIALVFLYFGQFQIKGFGAMLVINTLMSLVLNIGVFVGFVSILAFGLIMYKPSLMFSKELSDHIINIELTGFDSETYLDESASAWWNQKINFGKWWTWLVGAIAGFLSILGIILLVCGVGNNGLINNNIFIVQVIKPTATQILESLNIGVKDNLAHISRDLLSNSKIIDLIKNGSIQVLQANNYIDKLVVKSLVNTCLIAMGFCLIWSLLWLNFINIINVFVVQLVSLLTFGILGIFQFPIDINVIIMISFGFLINNLMIYSNFINLKFNYQMKANWNNQEIKDYVYQNQGQNITLYLSQYFITIGCLIILMLFVSKDNVKANGMVILNFIFNLSLIYILIPYLFYGMMIVREKYITKAANHRKHVNHYDYDKVDEQEILGINKHIYNQSY